MTANDHYEVLAIRYAERNNRIRADSFIFTDDHTSSHPMDYFVWLIRNETRTILVDTGYDATEAAQRGRPILVEPVEALADIGITPEMIDSIIVTHLHYDHAGGLAQFPQARLHLQEGGDALRACILQLEAALFKQWALENIPPFLEHERILGQRGILALPAFGGQEFL